MQSGFVESFNGRLGNKCLIEPLFTSLRHARYRIAEWRKDYTRVRLYSTIGNKSPIVLMKAYRS